MVKVIQRVRPKVPELRTLATPLSQITAEPPLHSDEVEGGVHFAGLGEE
jgi:hypothetical protein